jgi:hypothetical protein
MYDKSITFSLNKGIDVKQYIMLEEKNELSAAIIASCRKTTRQVKIHTSIENPQHNLIKGRI